VTQQAAAPCVVFQARHELHVAIDEALRRRGIRLV
jgi:hypothetical protein